MASHKDISKICSEQGLDESAYQMLVDHGRRRGKIQRDELVDVLPDIEYDGDLIDTFVDAIADEGISVEEADEEAARRAAETLTEGGDPALREIENGATDMDMTGLDVDDVLRLYLHEAGQVPLLKRDEEVALAQRIERCRTAREELSKGDVDPQRSKELQRWIDDGHAAREHLIRANARLVISVARRYINRGLPFTDLIQEGNIGLMRAIRNFDYHRGFKFSTYATWWIRQAVSRALADQSRTIRLPAYVSDQVGRLRRTQLQLQQRLGRAASTEELAAAMEMPPSRIEAMLSSMAQPMSLEAPVSTEDESELGDTLEDVNALDPEEAVEDRMENEQIRQRLTTLPGREREILELRYGIGGAEPLTLAEVGARLGITRERARQLELQAINRLRHPEAIRRRQSGNNKERFKHG
ncbi:MAG TPA: sigma-70 family RNA polymerase sigma factor [Anaerolineaceae bacterium]